MITDIQIIIYILMFVAIVMNDYIFYMQCRKKYIIVDFYLVPEIILLLFPHYIIFNLIQSVWYLQGEIVHVKMNLTDFFSFFMLFFIIRMLVNKIKNNTYL